MEAKLCGKQNWSKHCDLRLLVFGSIDDLKKWPETDIDPETDIKIVNKLDLLASTPDLPDIFWISVHTGEGVLALMAHIGRQLEIRYDDLISPVITRSRHRLAVQAARESIDRAVAGAEIELVAEELRSAANSIGKLTGSVDVDHILDVVFRDFCIGK